ncbi:RNA-directed DNA polymerase, eukaryota [Tanacetum coccineum]
MLRFWITSLLSMGIGYHVTPRSLLWLFMLPRQPSHKRVLWEYISTLLVRWNGETIIMGDFNKVRSKDERLGSVFNQFSARNFDHFITSMGLVDVKLEGYAFTWSHPSATKMSKLDHFLVTYLWILIRRWVKDKKLQQSGVRSSIIKELSAIDKDLDRGNVFDVKSRIKWAIEGDENSKFFHGITNKKRSQLSIRGVFVDGNWSTEPGVVKDAFKNHFAAHFKQPVQGRLKLNISFTNWLSSEQVVDMDRSVKYWRFVRPDFCAAVKHFFENGSFPKGCNSSFIALIPKVTDAKFVTDFRPISLIGCVYKVVTKVLAILLATVISDLVSDTQSAFVANRQILDGPFILNELLTWCKKKKKQVMFFKVDFAKAYDSVRWDYLLDVLQAFGFGPNWCRWIRGIFSSAMASILVNGSPTSKFPFFCVQLQGPMSISHLFYADDAMFIGEWSDSNLKNIAASMIGCAVMQKPFRYPGVKEMEAIRSKFFNGADISDRKITWAASDKVLASKKNGGLGVSSFHALNRALLLKWVWRFISQDASLWFRVIQAVYGSSFDLHSVNQPSIWCSILREVHLLKSKGFDFITHCKKRVEDGHSTRFWYDNWISDQSLRDRFPRLFALEMDKEATVVAKLGASSTDVSFHRAVRDEAE